MPKVDLRNLSNADLSGVDLGRTLFRPQSIWTSANLSYTNLEHCSLFAAVFHNANLSHTNLSHACLTYADFSEGDLRTVNFAHADLKSANLSKANLSGLDLREVTFCHPVDFSRAAKFVGSNLSGVNFQGCILAGAKLQDANLQGANLCQSNLTRADLTGADLSRANLTGATLVANFNRANLTGATLRDVVLVSPYGQVNFSEANLSQTDWSGMNLTDVDLRGANLNGANFSDVNLQGSRLEGADLRNANLTGADLRNTDWHKALRNEQTILMHSQSDDITLETELQQQIREDFDLKPATVPIGELQTHIFTGIQDDSLISICLHWQQYCDRRTNKKLYLGYFSYQGNHFTVKTRVPFNEKKSDHFCNVEGLVDPPGEYATPLENLKLEPKEKNQYLLQNTYAVYDEGPYDYISTHYKAVFGFDLSNLTVTYGLPWETDTSR